MSPPRLDTLRLKRSTPLKPANGSANRLRGPRQQGFSQSQTNRQARQCLAVSGHKLRSARQSWALQASVATAQLGALRALKARSAGGALADRAGRALTRQGAHQSGSYASMSPTPLTK